MTLDHAAGRTTGGEATGFRLSVLFGIVPLVVLATVVAVAAIQSSGGSSVPLLSAPATTTIVPRHADVPMLYYLVPTEEQAQAVLRAEQDLANARFMAGESDLVYEVMVVVVEDEASLNKALRDFLDVNWARLGQGLPEMMLIDLRGRDW